MCDILIAISSFCLAVCIGTMEFLKTVQFLPECDQQNYVCVASAESKNNCNKTGSHYPAPRPLVPSAPWGSGGTASPFDWSFLSPYLVKGWAGKSLTCLTWGGVSVLGYKVLATILQWSFMRSINY